MTQFVVPTLDGNPLPMPSTEDSSNYNIGTTLFTPTGVPRTQRQFSGQMISMSWEKLSSTDRAELVNQLKTTGFAPVPLRLTDGTTSLKVIPSSMDAYTDSKIEHLIADTARYNASMSWREVP